MPRTIWIALLLALSTALCAFGQDTTAWAGTGVSTGTYCYGGGTISCASYASGTNTNDLNGSGIDIASVDDVTASLGYGIKDGALYFTSGAYNGTAGPGGTWTWGSGGTLEITGCVQGATGTLAYANCSTDLPTNPVLLSDSFTSVTLTTSNGTPEYVFGGLTGSLSSALVTYINSQGGSLSAAFGGSGSSATLDVVTVGATPGSNFTTTSTSNQAVATAPVPEGWNLIGTLGLFGFGMVGFVIARRVGMVKPLTF